MANGEYNYNLSDFIVVMRNVISKEECDKIINLYQGHSAWDWAGTVSGVDLNHRKVKQIYLSDTSVLGSSNEARMMDQNIFNVMSRVKDLYLKTLHKDRGVLHVPDIQRDEGYQLLHYSQGYYFKEHVDNFTGNSRVLTCTLNLNSGYEGGLFRFLSGEFDVSLGAGDAVMFPSNFMFPHELTEITSGERYSIVTWFH